MAYKRKYLTRALKQEFAWLQKHYPVKGVRLLPLQIMTPKEFDRVYEVAEEDFSKPDDFNGFLDYYEQGLSFYFEINLVLGTTFSLDPEDEFIASFNQFSAAELPFFVLYHEYGHIRRSWETLRTKGRARFHEEMDAYSEESLRLFSEYEQGMISAEERYHLYRNLPDEAYADSFARAMFTRRRSKVQSYLRKI